jgi:uncharacterized protein (DUF1697 family)
LSASPREGVEALPRVYVALLRGINVAGKNRLSMDALSDAFLGVGCTQVETYIQSGNVVFQAPDRLGPRVSGLVAAHLLQRAGLHVPVVLRTADQLRAAARANPFVRSGVDLQTLHVAFLADRPKPHQLATLDPGRSPPDEFRAGGREVYLRFPNGAGRTKFTNAYLDSRLATTSTVRNWRTVLTLIEMADARGSRGRG